MEVKQLTQLIHKLYIEVKNLYSEIEIRKGEARQYRMRIETLIKQNEELRMKLRQALDNKNSPNQDQNIRAVLLKEEDHHVQLSILSVTVGPNGGIIITVEK